MDIATIAIIAVNGIISYKGLEDPYFFDKYKFNIAGIVRGEKYRFITSAFLHADLQHFIFNMITLYFFADIVIHFLDVPSFLLIYFVSLLAGNGLSYFMHKNEYHYSAIGASGAVSGIIYAGILLYPDMRIYGIIPGYIFGIGYLLYSIYGMKTRSGNIGHDAHFGGAVGGYVLTILIVPSLIQSETVTVLALLVPIIALFVLLQTGKLTP